MQKASVTQAIEKVAGWEAVRTNRCRTAAYAGAPAQFHPRNEPWIGKSGR